MTTTVRGAHDDQHSVVRGRADLREATVKTHLSRVLAKLGVRDRVQAVIAAFTAGVVQAGDQPPR